MILYLFLFILLCFHCNRILFHNLDCFLWKGYGSLGLMTSVLVSPDGRLIFFSLLCCTYAVIYMNEALWRHLCFVLGLWRPLFYLIYIDGCTCYVNCTSFPIILFLLFLHFLDLRLCYSFYIYIYSNGSLCVELLKLRLPMARSRDTTVTMNVDKKRVQTRLQGELSKNKRIMQVQFKNTIER